MDGMYEGMTGDQIAEFKAALIKKGYDPDHLVQNLNVNTQNKAPSPEKSKTDEDPFERKALAEN